MPGPIQSPIEAVSLVTLAVAMFGPQAGPYVVILLGSVAGSLWALSSATLETRMQGFWMMLRCVFTAVVFTALVAAGVASWFKQPVTELYAAVSFVIGMLGNRWQDIIESIKLRIQALISTTGGTKP